MGSNLASAHIPLLVCSTWLIKQLFTLSSHGMDGGGGAPGGGGDGCGDGGGGGGGPLGLGGGGKGGGDGGEGGAGGIRKISTA